MAEFPALPLWTDAYLADTRHLSTEEHGAYLLLMIEAWRRPECSLPDDDVLLARLAGVSMDRWNGIRAVVMAFWDRDGRRKTWTQKRLFKERLYLAQKSASQRDKAARRWKETKKDDATALPNVCPADAPTPTPTPIKRDVGKPTSWPFADFWQKWPNKVSRAAAEAAWKKLSEDDRQAVMASVPEWFHRWQGHNRQAAPIHAASFLNKRRWLDEFPDRPPDMGKGQTFSASDLFPELRKAIQ